MSAQEAFDREREFALMIAAAKYRQFGRWVSRDELRQVVLVALWKSAVRRHTLPADEFHFFIRRRLPGAVIDHIRNELTPFGRHALRKGYGSECVTDLDTLEDTTNYRFSYTVDMEETLDARARSDRLRSAMTRIHPRHRAVLSARLFDGRQAKDVAREFGVTEARVSQMTARAVEALRSILDA